MAHPLKHAQNSARKFGGKQRTTSRFIVGLMSRKHSWQTFVTEPFATMPRAFF